MRNRWCVRGVGVGRGVERERRGRGSKARRVCMQV